MPDTVSATYRSVTGRAVEDHAVVTLGYPDQSIGVIEAGFVSPNPFTIDIGGTEGTLRYVDGPPHLRVRTGEAWRTVDLPADSDDAFSQWVGHIRFDTRADDNLVRAVELTRLIVAANEAAASGHTIAYGR
jgi:1,5-anhydro-D-fructose reductase (1,5-anhydro-D-mannitol-forming)